VFAALLLSAIGLALTSTTAAAKGRWGFRTFTRADGLAHDIVRDVLQDKRGALWFATMGGVTRYEPWRCRYTSFDADFPAARRRVMALAHGADGAIWAATQGGGVGRFDGQRWRWYGTSAGLPAQLEITALLVDRQGRVWATPTGGGMLLFEGGRWRRHGAAEGLGEGELGRCVQLRGGAGPILCASYQPKRLYRYAGGRWRALAVGDVARRGFYVHDLLEAKDGRLWLATKGAGVIVGTPQIGQAAPYRWDIPTKLRIANARVGSLFEARDGTIWIATAGGVSAFDGKTTRSFSRADGLGSSHVFAITQAKDGALWLATLGGGVSRYGPTRWWREGLASGLPSETISGGLLRSPDGTLWAGTDQGLARRALGEKRWTVLPGPTPGSDHITDLARSGRDGALWVATKDGLRRRRAGRWAHLRAGSQGPIHPSCTALALADDGALWVGTAGGISRARGDSWRAWRRKDGLPGGKVNAVLVDRRGRTWVATQNGAARLDGGRWRAFTSHDAPASRTNRIYRLAEDNRGRIWASGLEGVEIFADGAWGALPPSAWLPAGIYSRFMLRTDSSLWFAVRGLGVRRLSHGRWTAYTSEAGLAADMVRDVIELRDGRLLFATLGGGISHYRPDRKAPQTHVGSPGSPPPTEVVHGEVLVLPFGGQDVLKDTPTAQLQFSWRADGGRWSTFSRQTRARLEGLAPGDHRFEVRAMDRDLNIDATAAVHRFTVVRPWYREPWLWALSLLALLALAYAGLRVVLAIRRERRAIDEEQRSIDQRKRFVRLASHELRKPLTRMAHRAEMLAMPEMREQKELVERYADALVGESKHLARLVESLLDQAKLEQGLELDRQQHDLRAMVAKLGRELGEGDGSSAGGGDGGRGDGAGGGDGGGAGAGAGGRDGPRVELPEGSVWVRVDPLYLQLALRNLIDNAQKYGGPQAGLELTLSVADAPGKALARGGSKQVSVTVRDHGPGVPEDERERIFEPFARGKTSPEHGGFGLGLPFARDIARAHGGDLVLKSLPEGQPGACFVLTLPALAGKARDAKTSDRPTSDRPTRTPTGEP
jgi:signal transduction histidine kinase/ligand-binding sensor domain-containing protein